MYSLKNYINTYKREVQPILIQPIPIQPAKILVFHFFEKVKNGKLKMANVNY